MYWQCTDESLSPRRKQNHTTKFFTEVTQFYSFILSRRCLRRSGQSRREKNNKICVKIEFYFFSISSKNNVGGSVNHKIKKVWPYLTFPMTEKYNNLRNPRVRICPSENIGVFFRSIKSLQTKIYDSKKIFRPFRKTARWSPWIHCIKFCNFLQFSFPQLVQMVFTESSADSRVVVHTGRPVTE